MSTYSAALVSAAIAGSFIPVLVAAEPPSPPPATGVPQLLQAQITQIQNLQSSMTALQNSIDAILSTLDGLPPVSNVLVTSPFPGDTPRPAFVYCLATNVGSTAAQVTMTMYALDGEVLGTQTLAVNLGITVKGSWSVGLQSGFKPSICRFNVANKADWRGSFVVDTAPATSQVAVIPAL